MICNTVQGSLHFMDTKHEVVMIKVRLFYTNGEIIINPADVVKYKKGLNVCSVEMSSGEVFEVDKVHFLMLYKNANNEINQEGKQ